jgi:3-hydroxyacyl-CoA dehydrogenase
VSIRRIGVVGAGVMGSEIAFAAAAAGIEVVLRDLEPALVERGLAHARSIAERRVARGAMSQEEADAPLGRITPAVDDGALAGCELAIEAVTELMDVKRDVFRRLDAALGPDALLASNTSGLSITELGRATRRPERVLGLHFFNPASTMRLVEVIRGADTSAATVAAGRELVERLGKTPVEVAECPGFLVNRVLVRALCEAYRRAAETGAAPAVADAAVVAAGPAPMGPFALADLIGIDTLAHVRRELAAAYGERFDDGGQLDRLVAAGRLGRKSGAGFYESPVEGVEPDAIGADVAERYYLGALDEARRCLEERVAAPEDLDLALRLGAGWSEGPLAWFRAQGDAARERMASPRRTLSGSRGRSGRRAPCGAGCSPPRSGTPSRRAGSAGAGTRR